MTRECVRVLKPTGSIFVNLGDSYAGASARRTPRAKSLHGLPWRYALGCIDDLDLILRAEIVWAKKNPLPESVTDRVRRSHEQWFHFTRQPRYFSAVDEVREPSDPRNAAHSERYHEAAKAYGKVNRDTGDKGAGLFIPNPLGKLPGSVWSIPSEPLKVPEHVGVDHFAAFPQEWPRRLILGWSPPGVCVECGEGRRPVVEKDRARAEAHCKTHGDQQHASMQTGGPFGNRGETTATITGYACACPDTSAPTRPAVVLDPFGGTGTVAMVARALGRYPVHIDLSADYLRLARWRVYESGHAAKSRERTNREAQMEMFA